MGCARSYVYGAKQVKKRQKRKNVNFGGKFGGQKPEKKSENGRYEVIWAFWMDIVTEKYILFHSQNSHHLVQNPLGKSKQEGAGKN